MFSYAIIVFEIVGNRFSYSKRVGGDAMTVYETLSLMIGFATLIVVILSFRK